MPRTFTLGDLVTRCKRRCNLEDHDLFPDSEWKQMISTAYAELFSEVAATGLRYFETTQTYTVDGSDSYDEPFNHMSTVGMDRIVNASGARRELTEIMSQERNRFAGMTGDAVAFALIDDQIYFYPKPTSGTYELVYVQQPPDLAIYEDGDFVDVVTPDGESFLLWAVAVQALAKEDSDTRTAREEREAARARVIDWARMRNLTTSRRQMVDDPGYGFDPADWRY